MIYLFLQGEGVMRIASGVSRWTMLHFGIALAALLLAEVLLVFGVADPLAALRAPSTLMGVHLITIGWLSLLMFGALFQFIPVIANTSLYSQKLPLYGLICIGGGLLAMLVGFFEMGQVSHFAVCLPVGGTLVLIGFTLGGINLAITLWRVRPVPLHAKFVVFALVFLFLTALLGISFALVFSLPISTPEFLKVLLGRGLSLHMAAGLGGWFMLTVMGVSYRLLSMFMLAPDEPRLTTHAALILTVAGLALYVVGGVISLWVGFDPWLLDGAASLLIALGLASYLADIIEFYRSRKRQHLELNSITAAAALLLISLSLVLGVIALALGELGRLAPAIGYLLVFGGLTGLGLGQLYKIIPFLTWLEVFGAKLGRGPVPRVQDLVNEPRAKPGFVLYFAASTLAAIALAIAAYDSSRTVTAVVFRVLVVLQLVGSGMVVVEHWRARHPDPNLKPSPMKIPGMPSGIKPPLSPAAAKSTTSLPAGGSVAAHVAPQTSPHSSHAAPHSAAPHTTQGN
ncbi:Hypothetical protein HDN1F_19910 [gamma proteobacterium HdN1]|nr:Hypothetical protein HDN1F_19910 [gamma proteobacterium HdN1]